MDILAHSLWAGAGLAVAARYRPISTPLSTPTVVATVVLAALPDVLHMLPIVAWWLWGDGTLATIRAYAIAVPGQEPVVPAMVEVLSHHLHCIMHSALVCSAVSAVVWAVRRAWWIPLWGWWSHIVIDVFTHSADYYPSPVFYPITQRGFHGVAWNEPWFMALNYAALVGVGIWLLLKRKKPPTGL